MNGKFVIPKLRKVKHLHVAETEDQLKVINVFASIVQKFSLFILNNKNIIIKLEFAHNGYLLLK